MEKDKRLTKSDKLPIAGDIVDGRTVRRGLIHNTSSISSSLGEYEILPDIRELSVDFFTYSAPYSKSEQKRTEDLANEIQESNQITPLIVVEDNQGFYILEGGHRFDALCMLKANSFPALVVKDLDSLEEGKP
jgi:hypothetical protein